MNDLSAPDGPKPFVKTLDPENDLARGSAVCIVGLRLDHYSTCQGPAGSIKRMRLIVTADLHYDIARSVAPTEALASRLSGERADGLVIVGDACGRDPDILRRCLRLFDRFAGQVFYVAGNHDLWTDGEDSLRRYERDLADICAECGVWYLDAKPWIRGGVALVGSIGWYDYTFRRASLRIPLRFYRHKLAPGAAEALSDYRHLLDRRDDVPPESLAVGTRWLDGVHVRLPMTDLEFTRRLHERLAAHLSRAAECAERIVVAMHHLPFARMVHVSGRAAWDFANAFMGSEIFGELLLSVPQVRYVVCGHTHRPLRTRAGRIECINVGCTYAAKRYEVIELA